MDGYYYNKPCYENKDYSSFYFFYPNGFFIGGLHDAPNKSLEIMDAYIDTVFHYRENRKNTVQDRGAFIVENNTVKIQFFACYYHCEVEDKKMRILNDSTFVFNEPVDKKEYKNYHVLK